MFVPCMHAQVAKRELALECDYTWEARSQARFKKLVEADASMTGKVIAVCVLRVRACRVRARACVRVICCIVS
jgi:hypothetical protein